MAKLTKQQAKMHRKACEILEQETLTEDEKLFVLVHWHEGADRPVNESGTFFTPSSFAGDFAIDVHRHGRVLDVCAGIGALSYFVLLRDTYEQNIKEHVCIELNPRFVEIGKKIVPEATWICADVFDLAELDLGHFDCVFGNPPFGKNGRTSHKGKRFDFELSVIDLVSKFANYGAFIIPQTSAPFQYSGRHCYEDRLTPKAKKFVEQTSLELVAGVGIDTAIFANDWKSTSIITEVVTVDFDEHREREAAAIMARAERAAQTQHTDYREQMALL